MLPVLYRAKGGEASIDPGRVWAVSSFNPLLGLPKTLDVKAVLCKIFLVRCGGSASSSVLCDKSHGCALSIIRLAGTGMSHQTHMLPWGGLTLHCMDPKYFCYVFMGLVKACIFAPYIFVT